MYDDVGEWIVGSCVMCESRISDLVLEVAAFCEEMLLS